MSKAHPCVKKPKAANPPDDSTRSGGFLLIACQGKRHSVCCNGSFRCSRGLSRRNSRYFRLMKFQVNARPTAPAFATSTGSPAHSCASSPTSQVVPSPTNDKIVNAANPTTSLFSDLEKTHSEHSTYCRTPPT